MNDVRFYEFLLQLNTYLRRSNILTDKFTVQEQELGKKIFEIKSKLPKDIFDSLFVPLAEVFERRVKLMEEIREANDGFEKTLKDYYEDFKGVVQ